MAIGNAHRNEKVDSEFRVDKPLSIVVERYYKKYNDMINLKFQYQAVSTIKLFIRPWLKIWF